MRVTKANIDFDNWVRCGNCGHKLMRVVKAGEPIVEIKCHSCKAINVWHGLSHKGGDNARK